MLEQIVNWWQSVPGAGFALGGLATVAGWLAARGLRGGWRRWSRFRRGEHLAIGPLTSSLMARLSQEGAWKLENDSLYFGDPAPTTTRIDLPGPQYRAFWVVIHGTRVEGGLNRREKQILRKAAGDLRQKLLLAGVQNYIPTGSHPSPITQAKPAPPVFASGPVGPATVTKDGKHGPTGPPCS